MISDAGELNGLCDSLRSLERVALDTEADSLHCYFEKLCLIQISLSDRQVLVDPLADMSLQPLLDVLREKTLLMHGADYDLRLLRRVGDFEAHAVFDTMIGARLLGWSELGLAALVQRHFGVELSKASQKANWALRPLPEKMLEYAQNDTRYLSPLVDIVEGELREKGRWEWFAESCERLVASTRETRAKDEEKIWRISGSATLSPHAQAILRSLWRWRDTEARNWDRPSFHVLGNANLLAISEAAAGGQKLPLPRLTGDRRSRFEQALQAGLATDPSEWPQIVRGVRKRPSRESLDRLDNLRKARDKAAIALKLDPAVIAPRAAMENFVFADDDSQLMRWQKDILGLGNGAPLSAQRTLDL